MPRQRLPTTPPDRSVLNPCSRPSDSTSLASTRPCSTTSGSDFSSRPCERKSNDDVSGPCHRCRRIHRLAPRRPAGRTAATPHPRRVPARAVRCSPERYVGLVVVGVRARQVAAPTGPWSPDVLHTLLRDASPSADERWRRWCADLLLADRLGPAELSEWWKVITEFDEVLGGYAEQPLDVPEGSVVVAGSGKEQFKTFNVSTAAAVLAAASGTSVVKGISRSVSAVSGAADILDVLDIRAVDRPEAIPEMLARFGIAFVSYPLFCPRYAARYDGVFGALNPASFFMPIATICVHARGYVLGLAHRDVTLAAAALLRIRPDLTTGVVASTELSPGEMIDEDGDVGTRRLARLADGLITCGIRQGQDPAQSWRHAVAHRPTHRGNAALVVSALKPGDDTPVTALVELNAALVVAASGTDIDEAVDLVRHARQAGHAIRLLSTLT
ncbi:hypothetical protein D0Q02_30365 [Micromonospora craniellae]|uniref:Glycosyl transferase family 3 domain-containing protein n=1 Tax=Micromonospora craniellae TaxID=2294034 RepID=A0A372FR70_9ACTN|nr:hypothetical protein D0Q02_30365 [Micromonospora craniellae]